MRKQWISQAITNIEIPSHNKKISNILQYPLDTLKLSEMNWERCSSAKKDHCC